MAADDDLRGRDRAGWSNICPRCLCVYWVRAIDQNASKARRFVSKDSSELHSCGVNA